MKGLRTEAPFCILGKRFRGRGKRGGARVLYYYVSHMATVFLIAGLRKESGVNVERVGQESHEKADGNARQRVIDESLAMGGVRGNEWRSLEGFTL